MRGLTLYGRALLPVRQDSGAGGADGLWVCGLPGRPVRDLGTGVPQHSWMTAIVLDQASAPYARYARVDHYAVMIAEHDLAGPLACWPLGIRS
jgi:hypothetical protein